MKKILLSMAAVAALAAAAPAYANHDSWYGRGNDYRYDRGFTRAVEARAAAFDRQVRQAAMSGRISHGVATSIIGQLRATVRLSYDYQRNGLSQREVAAIDRRFDQMERRLRYDRGYRYGGDYRRW